MKDFSIILAVDNENWIWVNGDLAWQLPEDMKYFKKTTSTTTDTNKQNAVVMGRKTWESIPKKYRPFSGRYNCVLSRSYTNGTQNPEWAYQFNSLDACLEHLDTLKNIESNFVIWWSQIFNQVLQDKRLKKAHITRIYHKYHCDTFFDGLPLGFDLESRSEMKEHEWVEFEFSVYTRSVGFMQKMKNIFNS